jgi:hypothetical protein
VEFQVQGVELLLQLPLQPVEFQVQGVELLLPLQPVEFQFQGVDILLQLFQFLDVLLDLKIHLLEVQVNM